VAELSYGILRLSNRNEPAISAYIIQISQLGAMKMASEPKKLYRSRSSRMISGVCGGLAEYLNLDPVVVRLIFVITAIFGASIGFWVYIIMWIAVPEQPAP
jgi:phage shock protein C